MKRSIVRAYVRLMLWVVRRFNLEFVRRELETQIVVALVAEGLVRESIRFVWPHGALAPTVLIDGLPPIYGDEFLSSSV